MQPDKIVMILSARFANDTNSDLFDNYKFNNTVGELSTDILLNFLQVLLNSLQSEKWRILFENEELTDTLGRLLHLYAVDLAKNRNNVKRAKKVNEIKLLSVRMLSCVLEKLALNMDSPITMRFAQHLGEREAIVLPETERSFSAASHRSSRDLSEARNELLEAHLSLIDRFLQIIVQRQINFPSDIQGSFYCYLTDFRFYSDLDKVFRSTNMSHSNERLDAILNRLRTIKDAESERLSNSSSCEKISVIEC